MADDFFKDKEEEKEEPEKLKVGESEFTPEELEELVGKAKSVKDFEEKQGQSWEDVTKSWGKRGERIGEYKKAEEELKARLEKLENPPTKEVVDQEKVKEQVLAEAKSLGIITKEDLETYFNEQYQTRRAGEKLYSSVNKVIRVAKKEGTPEVTPEKLLEYMADPSNPKDPQKAYNDMFSKELDDIKQKKIMSIKRQEFITEEGMTAGSKQPEVKVPQNQEELKQSLLEHLSASE